MIKKVGYPFYDVKLFIDKNHMLGYIKQTLVNWSYIDNICRVNMS